MREVERAKVLLGYAAGNSITELQRQLGFSRPMIYRCIDKALAAGVQMGLKDKYHRPHEPQMDSVKQDGRSNDIHLGRLDGDECRWLEGHGSGS